jgi:hypothetical protein
MVWKPTIPKFWPRLRTQLGKGTPVPRRTRGSLDCNIRSFQHGFGYLTGDRAVPLVSVIRAWMDHSGPKPTNLWDSQRAAKEADNWLANRGRKRIRIYLKFTKNAVTKAVRNKRIVTLAIDYGEWNRRMGRTGDPNFTGGHAITVLGEVRWTAGLVWKVYDSLEDNRRPEIPQGPKWRPRWKILKAAEVWARKTNNTEVVAAVYRGGGKY